MSEKDQGKLKIGMGLMISFLIIFVMIFIPVKNGKNSLNLLDDLFNQISKGSAYYIPKLAKDAKKFEGNMISLNLEMKNETMAKNTETIFVKNGLQAVANGSELKLDGDFGKITAAALADADVMYHNDGEAIRTKYGYDEREALYNWSVALHAMDKEFGDQKKFKEMNFLKQMTGKSVECAYNYYKIPPVKIKDKAGMVLFALIFYVIYTLWYGYAILYLFEGAGLETH